jgi:hypothetical protein
MKKKCWKTGKRAYKSKKQADIGKHTVGNHKGGCDPDIYSYKCNFCAYWHHGGTFRREMRKNLSEMLDTPPEMCYIGA